jgi:hypothetical protein
MFELNTRVRVRAEYESGAPYVSGHEGHVYQIEQRSVHGRCDSHDAGMFYRVAWISLIEDNADFVNDLFEISRATAYPEHMLENVATVPRMLAMDMGSGDDVTSVAAFQIPERRFVFQGVTTSRPQVPEPVRGKFSKGSLVRVLKPTNGHTEAEHAAMLNRVGSVTDIRNVDGTWFYKLDISNAQYCEEDTIKEIDSEEPVGNPQGGVTHEDPDDSTEYDFRIEGHLTALILAGNGKAVIVCEDDRGRHYRVRIEFEDMAAIRNEGDVEPAAQVYGGKRKVEL